MSIPLLRSAPYDLVVDVGWGLQRVQVKHIGLGRSRVDISRHGRRRAVYAPNEFDTLLVIQGEQAYLFPWPLALQHTLTLTLERRRDFEFTKQLRSLRRVEPVFAEACCAEGNPIFWAGAIGNVSRLGSGTLP